MKKISELFDRFKNFVPPERLVKEKIIDIVDRVASIKLTKEDIKIEKRAVRLKLKPAARSQLLIKKSAIMRSLQEELGVKAPYDVI